MRGITRLFSRIGKRSFFVLLAINLVFSQLAFMAPVFALGSTLSGTVTTGDTSQPLENATVEVLDQSTNAVVGSDVTVATGHYEVTVEAGTYNVRVTPPAGSEYQIATLENINLSTNHNLNIVLVLQSENPPPPTYYTWTGNLKDINGNLVGGCGGSASCFFFEATDGTQYGATINFNILAYQITAPAGQYKIGGGGFDMVGNDVGFNLTSDVTQDFIINQDTVNVEVIDQNGDPVPNARASILTSGGTSTQYLPDYQVAYGDNTSLAYTSASGASAQVKVLPGSPITSVIVDDASGRYDTVSVDNPTIVNGTITVQVNLLPPLPPNYTWTGNLKDINGNLVGGCGGSASCFFFEATDGTQYGATINFNILAYQITAPAGQYKIGGGGFDMVGNDVGFNLTSDVTQDFIINQDTVNVEVIDQYGTPVSNTTVTAHTSGGTGMQYLPDYQVTYGDNSATAQTGSAGEPAAVKTLSGSPVTSLVVTDTNGTVNFDTVTVNNPTIVDGAVQVQVVTDAAPPPVVYYTWTGMTKDVNGSLIGGCGSLAPGCLYFVADDGTHYDSQVNLSLLAYEISAPAGQYRIGGGGFDMIGTDTFDFSSDVTQDFIINQDTVNVQVIDQNGNPVPNARATVNTSGGTGEQYLLAYQVAYGDNHGIAYTSSDGAPAAVKILSGSPVISVVIESSNGTFNTITINNPDISSGGHIVVQLQVPYAPEAPQNLSATSPTNVFPELSWDAVETADSYKILRDGVEIGTAISTVFTDNTVILDGAYSYAVQACNEAGCSESSLPAEVVYDATAPELGFLVLSPDNIVEGSDTALSVSVTDNLTGVAQGEYFIGTDPGENQATTMQWDGASLSAEFGADLDPGTYQIGVRARDNAGNWSSVTTTELTVEPLDNTPPSIAPVLSPPAPDGDNGWYRSTVTLNWTVEDLESAITDQTGCEEFVLDADTDGVTRTCEATSAGGTSTESVTLKYDATAPTVGTPNWDENPQAIGSDATVTVPVTDATSGVTAGEYFLGSDPGIGNGTAMTLNSTDLSATLGVSLPLGDHTVSIRARDEAGNWSAVTTTSLTIEDRTAPVITYELTPAAPDGENNWYVSPVNLTWSVVDPESDITEQVGCDPVTHSTDALSAEYTCSATSAGGAASETVTINYDATAPVLGTPTWTANPVAVGSDTSFTVPATDATSGVVAGEYFIGTTDPGVGSATALTWDGTTFTSDSFGTTFAPGVYDISIRAKDNAGNWSATQIVYLVVFDPTGPGYIVGQQNVTPGAGDTLSWISTDTKDFATFGFNVEFTETGTVDPSSEFNFSYVEKGNCNSPQTPACHRFVLNATSFDWFAIGGTNNSEGDFQGTGMLEIDGVTSTVVFRIEAVDGNLLTPTVSDSFVMKVYAEGSNPTTTTPLYQVTADFTQGTGNANGGVQIKN